jgi:hypothetical protein
MTLSDHLMSARLHAAALGRRQLFVFIPDLEFFGGS